MNSKFSKTAITLFSIFLTITIVTFSIILLRSSKQGGTVSKEPQTVMYYKTIDVEVLESRITWGNTKSHYYTGYIKVKSKEYNIEEVLNISNGSPYFWEVYSRTLEQGQKIKATMYSWKKGNKIVKRDLGSLER